MRKVCHLLLPRCMETNLGCHHEETVRSEDEDPVVRPVPSPLLQLHRHLVQDLDVLAQGLPDALPHVPPAWVPPPTHCDVRPLLLLSLLNPSHPLPHAPLPETRERQFAWRSAASGELLLSWVWRMRTHPVVWRHPNIDISGPRLTPAQPGTLPSHPATQNRRPLCLGDNNSQFTGNPNDSTMWLPLSRALLWLAVSWSPSLQLAGWRNGDIAMKRNADDKALKSLNWSRNVGHKSRWSQIQLGNKRLS